MKSKLVNFTIKLVFITGCLANPVEHRQCSSPIVKASPGSFILEATESIKIVGSTRCLHVGMNFNDGMDGGDELALITFSRYGKH